MRAALAVIVAALALAVLVGTLGQAVQRAHHCETAIPSIVPCEARP